MGQESLWLLSHEKNQILVSARRPRLCKDVANYLTFGQSRYGYCVYADLPFRVVLRHPWPEPIAFDLLPASSHFWTRLVTLVIPRWRSGPLSDKASGSAFAYWCCTSTTALGLVMVADLPLRIHWRAKSISHISHGKTYCYINLKYNFRQSLLQHCNSVS